MSKYEPLWNWIKENGKDSFKLSFAVGRISMKEQTVSFEKNRETVPEKYHSL